MPREWLKGPNGENIHLNMERGRGKMMKCKFCRENYRQNEGKLCDFLVGNGKTCDAEMCGACARTLGVQRTKVCDIGHTRSDTIDVCPIHRDQAVVVGGKIQK
jgi:hypothetical protein